MYLKFLHLSSFRNYREQQVIFQAQKTILVGNNAQGKSNLLEAIELLSTLKSHRVSRDRELILEGSDTAYIRATLQRNLGEQELSLTLQQKGKRTVALNRESLRRHLDFLGIVNAVQFSSLDLDLVRGAPEFRRHWLDMLLVQLEPIYAHILQEYNQVLRQRNALLKTMGERTEKEELSATLEIWDEQLASTGSRVMRRRARAIERLMPLARSIHHQISANEVLTIKYTPNVNIDNNEIETVKQALREKIVLRRIVELHHGKTVVGPHRDEIEFLINSTPARYYGSQGQQRTLVLALKLAQLQLMEEVIGESPLLLLDDVLAELDLKRQNQLLTTIENRFQTLITTTHIDSFNTQWLKDSQILTVESGKISHQ